MTQKKVLVNILTYNSEKYIQSCIESVLKQTYPHIELIVTDNASEDGSVDKVSRLFPILPLWRNEENIGFARAHNAAIEAGQFDYYLPLNPDVILHPRFVEEVVTAVERDPSVGSANGKIFFLTPKGEKTEYIYSTGEEFSRARRSSPRGYKEKDSPIFGQEAYVFGANGAAPLYKREFLEAIKINDYYFDKDFFMYGEDVDLGWRGVLLGHRCLYVPKAVAYHYGFGSGGLKEKFIQYQYERNRFMLIYKNDLAKYFIADIPFFVFHECSNFLFYLLSSPGRVVQYVKAISGFLKLFRQKRAERLEIMARMRVDINELRGFYHTPIFLKLIRRRLFFKLE